MKKLNEGIIDDSPEDQKQEDERKQAKITRMILIEAYKEVRKEREKEREKNEEI